MSESPPRSLINTGLSEPRHERLSNPKNQQSPVIQKTAVNVRPLMVSSSPASQVDFEKNLGSSAITSGIATPINVNDAG